MGPRSHERGNASVPLAEFQREQLASMGPRSHERGNKFYSERPTRKLSGFNGAAFS